jgi:5-methylthioribose kinase
MREINSTSAADYLRETGRIATNETIDVCELSGGVSNVVLLITLPRGVERFVLKQARGRLRVQEEWLCPIERIWREVEVLRICGKLLQPQNEAPFRCSVPQVLWEDHDNYLYAMTAAPDGHRTWKEMLLAGEMQPSRDIATACGRLLADLHAGSWENQKIASVLDDRSYFDQLRLDPYYRHVARVHSDLAPHLERLIDSVWDHRRCLVHGDFSPKNLLIWSGQIMLIDFEVGHYGDPAFDLGFFLTHLILKSMWSGSRREEYLGLVESFWSAYQQPLARTVLTDELADLERRMLFNLAGCMLARVDGKSPVDYLSDAHKTLVRQLARAWLAEPPVTIAAALNVLRTQY